MCVSGELISGILFGLPRRLGGLCYAQALTRAMLFLEPSRGHVVGSFIGLQEDTLAKMYTLMNQSVAAGDSADGVVLGSATTAFVREKLDFLLPKLGSEFGFWVNTCNKVVGLSGRPRTGPWVGGVLKIICIGGFALSVVKWMCWWRSLGGWPILSGSGIAGSPC